MALSIPNVETGCRVWNGPVDRDGEPTVRVRGTRARVKWYLTAKKRKLEGYYVTYENTCGNRLCVTVSHLRIVDREPLDSRGHQVAQ